MGIGITLLYPMDHGPLDHSSTWNRHLVDQNYGYGNGIRFSHIQMYYSPVSVDDTIKYFQMRYIFNHFQSHCDRCVHVCVYLILNHIWIHYFISFYSFFFHFLSLNENWEHCSERINCGLDIRMFIHIRHHPYMPLDAFREKKTFSCGFELRTH